MDVVLSVFQHLGLTVSDLDTVAADACLGVLPVGKVPRHAPEVTIDDVVLPPSRTTLADHF